MASCIFGIPSVVYPGAFISLQIYPLCCDYGHFLEPEFDFACPSGHQLLLYIASLFSCNEGASQVYLYLLGIQQVSTAP